jgi:methylated-DNA-[protein]-cysteine S-methyltransferase
MTPSILTCREVEPDLIAVATAEASPAATRRVETHLAGCAECREELGHYQAVEGAMSGLRREAVPGAGPTLARAELENRLADLRSRLVRYGVFESALGPILIGTSEQGVSVVEYMTGRTGAGLKLARRGADAMEDRARTEGLFRDLSDYLEGRRMRLDWPLDLRLAGSDFQRRVLEATARLPYGAVASYARIARELGAPKASRAVAQALRHNPLPIVVPCHRVVGSDGDLVGYAGNKIGLKQRLLSLEGIHIAGGGGQGLHVDRNAVYYRHLDDTEYCIPTCGTISESSLGEFTVYASRARAEGAGLAPCTSCRPDLHPLPA